LYVSINQLTSIPESISDLSSLEYLGLSRNQLTSIPESICNIPNSQHHLPINCYIYVYNNYLCEEYHYDCIDSWGTQDQSNCCEGVNDDGETVPNWTTCPE